MTTVTETGIPLLREGRTVQIRETRRSREFPSLAKEGWLRHKEMVPFLSRRRRGGWFKTPIISGSWNQPPRPLLSKDASHYFLEVASTPPLPRRGIRCSSPQPCSKPHPVCS